MAIAYTSSWEVHPIACQTNYKFIWLEAYKEAPKFTERSGTASVKPYRDVENENQVFVN